MRSASFAAVAVCALDADLQRLQPLEQHPGVERAERRAGLAQEGVEVVGDELLVGEDDAAEAAALAVDVLGRRIDDDVGAELQRLLQERRGEDVVDDQPRAGLVGDLGDRGDVDDFERRIGRAFEEAAPWSSSLTACPPLAEVGAVDQRRGDAVARQQLLDDVAARAEQRLRRDDVVAGLEVAEEDGGDRRHAARRRPRGPGAFEKPHALLEHGDGRVGVARIDEAGLLALEARRRLLGAVVDVALGQEDRLGVLAELRAEDAAVDELGRRPEGLRCAFVLLGHVAVSPTKNPAARSRAGFHPSGLLATSLTWLQAGRLK